MNEDVGANPGLLKLDLYCKGMRVDDSCLVEEDGGRRVLRTRAGLGSGLELVLPGGLWTNVPVTEPFAQASPYVLKRENGSYRIHRDPEGEPVATVTLSPRPLWYERRTSTGKPMTRIGTLQGTYLGIYQAKVCAYWTEKVRVNCRFCSVGLNLGIDDAGEKTLDEVMEVVWAARRESGITYVDFNTGHLEGETYLDILEPFVKRIKKEVGLLVGIQTPPHSDLSRYDALREMGVNRVSFCFEIFDSKAFKEICPGKYRQYGLERYLDAVRYCAALGRKGPRTEPLGDERRDHRRPRAARVLDPRDRLDHLGGRDPHGLRVPSAGGDRLPAPPAAQDRGDGAGVRVPLRGLHEARAADRRGAGHPREPGDAAGGVPLAHGRTLPARRAEAEAAGQGRAFRLGATPARTGA